MNSLYGSFLYGELPYAERRFYRLTTVFNKFTLGSAGKFKNNNNISNFKTTNKTIKFRNNKKTGVMR